MIPLRGEKEGVSNKATWKAFNEDVINISDDDDKTENNSLPDGYILGVDLQVLITYPLSFS